jgi:hypothetical protein
MVDPALSTCSQNLSICRLMLLVVEHKNKDLPRGSRRRLPEGFLEANCQYLFLLQEPARGGKVCILVFLPVCFLALCLGLKHVIGLHQILMHRRDGFAERIVDEVLRVLARHRFKVGEEGAHEGKLKDLGDLCL